MGVGNPLMGDEGVGVRVVEQLMAGYEYPDRVELVDAGTMGFTILDLLRDVDRLIVIDAIDGTRHAPGTVVVLSPEDIAPNSVMHSLHDTRLVDVLQAAALMGITPQAVCIGIQIGRIEQWVLELSEPVEQAVPIAAAATIQTLRDLAVEPTPRGESSVDAAIIEALRTYAPMPDGSPRATAADPDAAASAADDLAE
jgi:hydrogenase maturation protease